MCMDRLLKSSKIQRTVHEVDKDSNLDLLLRGFHGIGNRLVDAILALAVALSTGEDNSSEIRELTTKIRASRESIQEAVDRQKGQE